MLSKIKVLVLISAVVGQFASANNTVNDPAYFEITSIKTEEIQDSVSTFVGANPIGLMDCSANGLLQDGLVPSNPLDEVDMIVDKVINIGKKVWNVIELGRPVVNFKTDIATAMPEGARCWNDLQQWQAPKSKTYGVTMRNGFNSVVVKFVYRVNYLVGGTADGVGRFIGYATTMPKDLYVAWGFTFNAKASVPTVYNMGTRKDPIAGMQINMQYTVNTVMNHLEQSQSYSIDGLGNFVQLD